jgi:hypothetical protein
MNKDKVLIVRWNYTIALAQGLPTFGYVAFPTDPPQVCSACSSVYTVSGKALAGEATSLRN